MNKVNSIILELNSRCNNNCVYCYIPEKSRVEKSNNAVDYFKNIMLTFRNENVINVDFAGGEPTIYPYLFYLVNFSKNIGYENRTLITNGRMLSNKEYCHKVFKSGINRVVISLDGPNKKICELITRTPGSYEQTLSAIKNIKANKIDFGITIVVNKLNYKYISETIGKSLDFDANFINIQFLLPHVKDKNVICKKIPPGIIPNYEESSRYVKIGLERYGYEKQIRIHFIPFCFMKGYEKYVVDDTNNFDRLVINWKGYSYNIGEHLQRDSVKTEKCINCAFSKKCRGFFKSYAKEFGTKI